MSNKEIFIQTVEELFKTTPYTLPKAVFDYLEQLKATEEKVKPLFTENGAKILRWMQENYVAYNNIMKSKEIGEGLFCSSRTVSGSIRKLVTDGYVSKTGGNPICYSLTDLGMACEIPDIVSADED